MPGSLPSLRVLPSSTRYRALIEKVAQEAGLAVSDAPETALQLYDFTAGPDEVKPKGPISLGLVTEANFATAAASASAADLLAVERLESELLPRLQLLRVRHAIDEQDRKRRRDVSILLQHYATALDVETLLHDVTRKLAEEMGIARASLIVVDERSDSGVVVAASDDAALKDHRIELARYPEIREVVRTGKPLIVEDAASHPLLEGVKGKLAEAGIHVIAAFPLAIEKKVLGVMLLRASEKRGPFTLREMDYLSIVAHATAVALRNARLFNNLKIETAREQSARQAAEERARDLQRYESYFAQISDGIAVLDQKACLLSLNPAGRRLLGAALPAVVGQHLSLVLKPLDEERLLETLLLAASGQTCGEVDIAAVPEGKRLILSVSAAPLREGGAAAILSFRDVTQQRALAEELRQTKEFLERLIDSSVDAIIAADMRGKIILFNKGAELICGYTAEQARGLQVADLYRPGVAKEVMKKLRDGKGRLGVSRMEIMTRGGPGVPVNMTASIVYEGDREVATVGIFTDLRDRMELEEKLHRAEGRLDEAEKNAVIVALAGTAAHELNQPLTSVMGYAELLKRKLSETDYAFRPVDIIYREAERMAEIVRKIGKITRYETKTYVGSSQILDLDKSTSHEE